MNYNFIDITCHKCGEEVSVKVCRYCLGRCEDSCSMRVLDETTHTIGKKVNYHWVMSPLYRPFVFIFGDSYGNYPNLFKRFFYGHRYS